MRAGILPATVASPSSAPAPGFLSVGQAVARAAAIRMVARGLQRPLLLQGSAGSGKQAFLADLLALLVCAEPSEIGPCNACPGCARSRAGRHVDIVFASPATWTAARQTNESLVAVARRWLLEVAGAPLEAQRRVVVIEQADRCNEPIQNALLKALEEPSPRHIFVLVADDPERLLPTVRSRCQPLRIGPVPWAELSSWLVDVHHLPAGQADALARLSGGRIGLASRLVERTDIVEWQRQLLTKLLQLVDRGREQRFGAVRDALEDAARPLPPAVGTETADADGAVADATPPTRTPAARQRRAALAIVDAWLGLARDLAVAAAGRPSSAATADLLPELPAVAARMGAPAAARFARRLEAIRDGLEANVSPRLALEVAMLDWPALELPAA